jgi:hypothetical protein
MPLPLHAQRDGARGQDPAPHRSLLDRQRFCRVPSRSELAGAIRYALSRWAALSLTLADGRRGSLLALATYRLIAHWSDTSE